MSYFRLKQRLVGSSNSLVMIADKSDYDFKKGKKLLYLQREFSCVLTVAIVRIKTAGIFFAEGTTALYVRIPQ